MIVKKLHVESPETNATKVDDEGDVVKFNSEFSCLGSIINR